MPNAREITRHKSAQHPEGQSPYLPGKGPTSDIRIVPYDPDWPALYDNFHEMITRVLGDDILSIDHIGSTAVPGLSAKPIIDITITVPNPARENEWVPKLEAVGFDLTVREPWWHEHRMMRYTSPAAHLHVFGSAAPEPIRHRLFRDWLISRPKDRNLYEQSKFAASDEKDRLGQHVMDYNTRKEHVIHEIYERAFRNAGLI